MGGQNVGHRGVAKTKGMGTELGFENTFTKLVVYKLLDFRLPRKFKKA